MEKWRTIKEYPNYKVSNMGNVKHVSGNILKPFDRQKYSHVKSRVGYMTVHFAIPKTKSLVNKSVHSLVMEAFCGKRPPGYVINHKNGIKWDNRLENLEYCTVSHNRKQDFIMGRQSLRGEKNTQAKLSEDDVKKIIQLYNTGGYTYKQLSKKYGVHLSGISNIFNGHCWSYLTGIEKRY